MRRRFLFAALALCLMIALAAPAMAAGNTYGYTVRIFAGAQGKLDGDKDVIVYEDVAYGSRINFDINRVDLPEDSKYYVKGIRESGKDNNTVSSPSIYVTGDIDYVVAYGIRGSLVAYTVNYVDEEGDPVADSQTFYGNVGDKPVVAYQYVEGYQPQAYNLGLTLTENAADNVFTFVYSEVVTEVVGPAVVGPTEPTEPVTPPEVIPPAPTPAVPGPGGEDEEIDENQTPGSSGPSQYEDLDPNDIPGSAFTEILADARAMPTAAKVTISACTAVVLGTCIWLLFKKRNKKGEEDE